MAVEVLIVEDNPGDADLIRHLLSEKTVPVKITVTGDGESALRIIGTSQPDVVLLDINLPRIDGHQVLRLIRQSGDPEVVVIVMSSSLNPADHHSALNAGANEYMTKGHGLEEFERAMDEHVYKWVDAIAQRKKMP
jgi:CheY-like chemotaxis protein